MTVAAVLGAVSSEDSLVEAASFEGLPVGAASSVLGEAVSLPLGEEASSVPEGAASLFEL
jgi:hypothetical protein